VTQDDLYKVSPTSTDTALEEVGVDNTSYGDFAVSQMLHTASYWNAWKLCRCTIVSSGRWRLLRNCSRLVRRFSSSRIDWFLKNRFDFPPQIT